MELASAPDQRLFPDALERARRVSGNVSVLRPPAEAGTAAFDDLLEEAERSSDLVLLVADVGAPDQRWTDFCIRQADEILAVAAPDTPLPAPGLQRTLAGCELVFLGKPASADLLSAEVVVDRRGLLWRAVGKSMSLPGIVAPTPEDGKLLVDGGVLNNLPVDVMAARPEGPNRRGQRHAPAHGRGRGRAQGTEHPRDADAGDGARELVARLALLVSSLARDRARARGHRNV